MFSVAGDLLLWLFLPESWRQVGTEAPRPALALLSVSSFIKVSGRIVERPESFCGVASCARSGPLTCFRPFSCCSITWF